MGYGSRALQILNSYYSAEMFNLDEAVVEEEVYANVSKVDLVSRLPSAVTMARLNMTSSGHRPSERQSKYSCPFRHAPALATPFGT